MALTNEGEQFMLDVFTSNESAPTLYLGLASSTPTESSTLATITEVTGDGYARQELSFPAAGDVDGSGSTTSGSEVFTASGTWSGATHAFVTDVASGTSGVLVAFAALSSTRTLTDGDTLTAAYRIDLE